MPTHDYVGDANVCPIFYVNDVLVLSMTHVEHLDAIENVFKPWKTPV